MQEKIPKTIHYCWFGGKEIPETAKNCIESWRKFCPDYEIKEWNELNYDLSANDYVKEAAACRKWAFVSDFARFDILHQYGGIYLDTDVELLKSIDDIVENGPFMGLEQSTRADGKTKDIKVATGLGIGAYRGHRVYKDILDGYERDHFTTQGTQLNVVTRITEYFLKCGWIQENRMQVVNGITLYPSEYFCPIDNMTGKIEITDNTRSIHHYDASWMNTSGKISIKISRAFSKTGKVGHAVGTALSIPFRLVNKVIIK